MASLLISLIKSSGGGGGASLPSQTGNAGKFLKSNGTNASWQLVSPLFAWKAGRYYNINQVYPASDFGQTQALTANTIYATPLFVPPGSGAIDRVTLAVQTGAGTNSRLMYFAPGADGHPGALLFDFGTVNTSSGGDKELSGSWTLPEGPGWLAVVPDGAITVYLFSINGLGYIGDSMYISGTAGSPYRPNGGTTAPNPFGTSSLSYLGYTVRLGIRAA